MIAKKPRFEQARISDISIEGCGIGTIESGRGIRVWGALPGEIVQARIIKKRPCLIGIADTVIADSPRRIQPKENHFLSCSPWQIIPLEIETLWKKNLLVQLYGNSGLYENDLVVHEGEKNTAYRNKMEYAFFANDDGLNLAFHRRGIRAPIPIASCILADHSISEVSHNILRVLQEREIPRHSLKSIVIRCNQKGETIAGLFMKNEEEKSFDSIFSKSGLRGMEIYYSDRRSPASVPTKPLASFGAQTLTDTILGKTFSWSLFSFLQGNLPLFERALARIHEWSADSPALIDAYAGIGVIGLTSSVKRVTIVESNPASILLARKHAILCGKPDTIIVESPTEKISGVFTPDSTVILDPPRSGLHHQVIKNLLKEKPRRIIYLSCNPATQVRDISLLAEQYLITALEAYNFFPRTPHIESLALLDLR